MKTFNDKLKEAKILFDNPKEGERAYEKKAIPEVKAYNLEYRQVSGKYPYNQAIEDYILTKEKVDTDLIDHLGTEIYLSQHDIDNDKTEEHKQKMLADGWLELKHNTEYRGKCHYVATKEVDWMSGKIENTGTIISTNDEHKEAFLLPKGKRNRGYYVRNLKEAFYKPLVK